MKSTKPNPRTQRAGKPRAKLTVKQQKFAVSLLGTAQGNQALAAKLAGYKGDNRQLAVQGSVNASNPKIKQMISEMLDAMVEHGLERLAESLDATKVRSFVTKKGELVQSDPEPDHVTRLRSVELMFRLRGQLPLTPATEFVEPEQHGGPAVVPKEVAAMEPTDRALFREAAVIEEQLAEVKRQLDEDGDGDPKEES